MYVHSTWCLDTIQVASARFARFSYCGHGFARSAHFTSYGNPVCTIEVVKLNTYSHGVETEGYRSDGCSATAGVALLTLLASHCMQPSVCPSLK